MDVNVPDTVFRAAGTVAALGWLALALSPASARWAPAVRRVTGRVMPLGLALVYVVLIAAYWTSDGGFGSLAEVQRLFAVPGLLVAGWLHYLAFDLFVGSWIAERAAVLRMPHAIVVLLLLLSFLFGPAGLLAYAVLRLTVFRVAANPSAAAAA